MEWLIFLVAGAGGALAGRQLWDRRRRRAAAADDVEQVRKVADEDVTLLGEELQRLGVEVADRELDVDARLEYQRALDAYESAQRAVARLEDVDEIGAVADTLANGRYSMVCVRARLAGDPIPGRRVPCFFNPQHGPSVTDIVWTPPGRGTRKVPACAQDAARVAGGEKPDVRYVQMGALRVPYWEAGRASAPYGKGYFVGTWTWTAWSIGPGGDLGGMDFEAGFHAGGMDAGGGSP